MFEASFIACDLGAGSGRVILGQLQDDRLVLDEVHRFESLPVSLNGTLRWDIAQIAAELKIGLGKVGASGRRVASVSVDSWGVDYVLLRAPGTDMSMPYHYRDPRTAGAFAAVMQSIGPELIFQETGIQFMPFNTLYQLAAEIEQDRAGVETAEMFLNIADYLNFILCGVGKAEDSLASTTQLYNPSTRRWSSVLMGKLGLPERLFPEIVAPGTTLGPLLPAILEETKLPPINVVATCSHDTAAAVVAVPAAGEDWAFLSSGTWSLIGIELSEPLINDEVRALNFTNEAGFGGTTRFLKNIAGLWLLQESQRAWKREGVNIAYAELSRRADACAPLRSLVSPADPRFVRPADMPEEIAAFCRETDQPIPETPPEYTRCIYESLALLYAVTLQDLEHLTGRSIGRLHIVGGGASSLLLNQLTADAIGRTVLAGPIEATAAGNCLVQAIASGHVASLEQARQIVRHSFPIQEFQPRQSDLRKAGAERFAHLTFKHEKVRAR